MATIILWQAIVDIYLDVRSLSSVSIEIETLLRIAAECRTKGEKFNDVTLSIPFYSIAKLLFDSL